MSPPPSALAQAAEWFALMRGGAAGAAQRAEWQAWLAQHADHREAWRRIETICGRFAPLQGEAGGAPAAIALQAVRARPPSRRQLLLGLAATGGAASLGWGLWQREALRDHLAAASAPYRTATGEIRELTLADGSHAVLDTASALSTAAGPAPRHLRLLAGGLLLDVAHDPLRPLLVDTPAGSLRSTDGRFTVRRGDGDTLLAVHRGSVEIRSAGGGAVRVLDAGRQTRFDAHRIAAPQPVQAAHEARSRGVLLAEDMALGDLVAELSRYRRGHLGVDEAIAGLRVIGGYPLRHTDQALAMLAQALPIRVRRRAPWWVTLCAREPA